MKMRERAYIPVRKDEKGDYILEVGISEVSNYTKEEVEEMITEIRKKKYIGCMVLRDERGRLLGLELPEPK